MKTQRIKSIAGIILLGALLTGLAMKLYDSVNNTLLATFILVIVLFILVAGAYVVMRD